MWGQTQGVSPIGGDANIGEEEKVEEDMIIADDGEALVAAMAVLFPWT